jgi:hypothetical protein
MVSAPRAEYQQGEWGHLSEPLRVLKVLVILALRMKVGTLVSIIRARDPNTLVEMSTVGPIIRGI